MLFSWFPLWDRGATLGNGVKCWDGCMVFLVVIGPRRDSEQKGKLHDCHRACFPASFFLSFLVYYLLHFPLSLHLLLFKHLLSFSSWIVTNIGLEL
jgi:hypothetical protein